MHFRTATAPAWLILVVFTAVCAAVPRQTAISISGQSFLINGKPTYEGRAYNGIKIEGLLLNARLVQATFDDLNPATRHLWKYPHGKNCAAARTTDEFLAALPLYRKAGLISFTINFQGGSPQGYSKEQPWHNSAFESDGSLRPDYLRRIEKVVDRADELGMIVIVGFFYFGQQYRLGTDEAVLKAADNATYWLLSKSYTNVLIEIANETNQANYTSPLLKPEKAHELIERVRQRSKNNSSSPPASPAAKSHRKTSPS